MTAQHNEPRDWFTIFRCGENAEWLYAELVEGRLRQGWGGAGLGLMAKDGTRLEKKDWEQAYREEWHEDPSPRRFAILSQMLDLNRGDIVIVPKMPEWNQFTLARVAAGYRFEHETDRDDFRHIVDLEPPSIRTFDYRANDDSYLISGLFARACHWPAVSCCYSSAHLEAAHRLLIRESSASSEPQEALIRNTTDDALRKAANELNEQVAHWNGPRFEDAVRHAFRNQGYEVKRVRADGKGGDVDILAMPPASRFGLFLPEEIAVQVKWRQGVDEDDLHAVKQLVDWAESKQSNAAKYVISSASKFTEKTREEAEAKGVVLIGGLQAMCFLLGISDRYRPEWEEA